MSARRTTETCTCWKSCQSCESRRIGSATWPAIMLKATSDPTVSSPSMTACAPNRSRAAEVTLLTYWMAFWPLAASSVAAKEARHRLPASPPTERPPPARQRSFQRLNADDASRPAIAGYRAAIELLVDALLQERADQKADCDVERDGGDNDPRERDGIGKQNQDEDNGKDEIEAAKQALASQESYGSSRVRASGQRSGRPPWFRNS